MTSHVIGKTMNNGYAGNYARQPDMIIETRPNKSSGNIRFGSVLQYDATGAVAPADAAFTAAKFAGIAGKEIRSSLNYLDQNSGGEYPPDSAVSVFQRGSINVICASGTPALGGAVYVATAAAGGVNVGDLMAATATGAIQLTNAQWGGTTDVNNVAELVLLTRSNA